METQSASSAPLKSDLLRLRPLGPAETFDAAFVLYLRSPGTFITLAAIPLAIASAVGFGVDALTPPTDPGSRTIDIVASWLTTFVGIGLAATLVTRAGAAIWWGATPSIGDVLGTRGWGRALGAIGVFALAWIPVAWASTLPTDDDSAVGLMIFVLLVAVPIALVISLVNCLSLTVLAAESPPGLTSTVRSWRLMRKGAWARASLTFLLAALLFAAMFSAFGIGVNVVLDLLPTSDASLLNIGVSTLVSFVLYSLATPLLALIPTAIYFESRVRTEGLDVELLLHSEMTTRRAKRRLVTDDRSGTSRP